jgi:hypothetical protein
MPIAQNEKVKRIAEILKKRFPNLTAIELINMAYSILEAIENE